MPYRVEAVADERSWADFLGLPHAIYDGDTNWVPPLAAEVRRTLDAGANPYFEKAKLGVFICYRDERPVARACAVANPAHWEQFGERAAFFGFYESADDPEASGRLFDAVSRFCREAGAETVEGPFNPNHYSELGLLVGGFDTPPVFFETYNPRYYSRLLEGIGFGILRRLHTRSNPDVGAYIRRRYGSVSRPGSRGEYRVRPFRLLDMKTELERIRSVFNNAFAGNWHFLPLSAAEYSFAAKYLFFVTYPRLVAIVEHRGEPIGVLECALDVNPLLRRLGGQAGLAGYSRFLAGRGRIRDVVLYAVGIRKDCRGTMAYRLLLDYGCWALRDCRAVTTTWMTDDNIPALGAASRLGLEPSKQFAIYRKRLGVAA
jgi:hypothetical protein